jgi:hypothetical protein
LHGCQPFPREFNVELYSGVGTAVALQIISRAIFAFGLIAFVAARRKHDDSALSVGRNTRPRPAAQRPHGRGDQAGRKLASVLGGLVPQPTGFKPAVGMIRVFSVKQELWLCDALDVPTRALRMATGETSPGSCGTTRARRAASQLIGAGTGFWWASSEAMSCAR